MKKVLIIIVVLCLLLTGCVRKSIKDNVSDNTNNNTNENELETKKDPIYSLEIGKEYEDITNLYNGASLRKVILQENNQVEQMTCAAGGGCSDYRGTYKIEGNTLTTVLTEYDSLGIDMWDKLPEEDINVYTIIENNTFKDEYGTYTLK